MIELFGLPVLVPALPWRKFGYATLSLALVFLLGACGSLKNDGSNSGSNYNPPVGSVDDTAGFYMRYYRNNNYTYYDHAMQIFSGTTATATPVTTDCVATQGQKVYCAIEAQEGDLYYNGVQLQYNVPSTMCSYITWMPYFYYQLQPGVGPTLVHSDTDSLGNVGWDKDNSGVISTGAGDVLGGTTCPYDYTQNTYNGVPGPNCCIGTYTLIVRVWDPTTGAYGQPTVSTPSWGGSAANCLAGPAMDSQPKDAAGFPEASISYVQGTGVNTLYTIEPPLNKFGSNTVEYAANYFTNAQNGTDNAPAAPAATLPTAMNPGGFPVSAYYDLTCLDRAFEVQAEILMVVRKWNTGPAFGNFLADPTQFNITGNEPAPWASDPLDDFEGWLELGNSYPGPGR